MIFRMSVLIILASFFLIIGQCFATIFSLYAFPILVTPMIAIYAAYNLPLGQCGFLAICMGIIIDALTGHILGVSSLVLLLVMLLSTIMVSFLGKPSFGLIFLTALGVSIFYRVLWPVLILLFTPSSPNINFLSFLWAPAIDGLLAVIYFWLIEKVLLLSRKNECAELGVVQNGSI